jgi:hypothetical protein
VDAKYSHWTSICTKARIAQSIQGPVMRWMAELRFSSGEGIFIFAMVFREGPIQLPTQLIPRVERPKREDDRLLLSTVKYVFVA